MTQLAKLYGGSLYDLIAGEPTQLDQTGALLEELDLVVGCLRQEPDYLRLLSTPGIPKRERCALLDEAFGGQVHPYLVNFLKILCEKGALRELPACARAYRSRYNQAHGILEVTATAAAALSAENEQALRQKLAAMTGKTIDLAVRVDPTLLGGIRLDLGGVQLDGTVRHRLDALRREIDGAVL